MKSKIIIEIETDKLKPCVFDGDDFRMDQENEFHEQLFKQIEGFVQDEDFERKIMSNWADEAKYLNPKAKEFSDIGNLMIKIMQEKY